jgi:hypothetical protein
MVVTVTAGAVFVYLVLDTHPSDLSTAIKHGDVL